MFEDNNADFELDDEFLNAFATKHEQTEIKTDNNGKFRKPPPQVVKRKFPGPAGILPDCKNFDPSILNENSNNNRIEIPCSQSSISIFQDDLWLKVQEDYRDQTDLYTIDWIKNQANLNRLNNQKAPFLAGIVQNLEYFDERTSMINVQLHDPTGRIQGTMIVDRLSKDVQSNLTVGCVIILKRFGVLTTDTTSRRNHYLTITPKNLVGIYYRNRQDDQIQSIIINDFIDKNRNESSNDIDLENSSIWRDILNDIDTDRLFDDF